MSNAEWTPVMVDTEHRRAVLVSEDDGPDGPVYPICHLMPAEEWLRSIRFYREGEET